LNLSRERLEAEAAESGFAPEILEKIAFLLAVLEGVNRHPLLRGHLALKGGTALNLFTAGVPRLSVDIDLNYVGDPDVEAMRARRPDVERAIQAVCEREGLLVRTVPGEHAGGSWSLAYRSAYGGTTHLKVDVVFMYRVPLWQARVLDSVPIGGLHATGITVVDEHELAAGKLVALLSRHAGRDLFDSHRLLKSGTLDHERLRLAFVVYGGMSRRDWRSVHADELQASPQELGRNLVPLLRASGRPGSDDLSAWAEQLVADTRAGLAAVLPLRHREAQFLDLLLDEGQVVPELLTDDEALRGRIQVHPGLEWKALNVRKFRDGLDPKSEPA